HRSDARSDRAPVRSLARRSSVPFDDLRALPVSWEASDRAAAARAEDVRGSRCEVRRAKCEVRRAASGADRTTNDERRTQNDAPRTKNHERRPLLDANPRDARSRTEGDGAIAVHLAAGTDTDRRLPT